MTINKTKKVDLTKSKEGEGATISAVELAELQKAAAKVKDLEKAKKDAEAKVEDLEKSKAEVDAKLQEVEMEKAAKAKEVMTDLVKGFTFINEEDQEATVDSLLKNKDSVILSTLQKAQEVIDEFATAEHGSDASGADLEKSAAQKNSDDFDALGAEIMKQRKNQGAK